MILVCANSIEEDSIIILIENNERLVEFKLDLNRSFKNRRFF